MRSYRELDAVLSPLIAKFGRRGSNNSAPFWYLQDDGVWEISSAATPPPLADRHKPTSTRRNPARATGGFVEPIHRHFRVDLQFAMQVVSELLEQFPTPSRDPIAAALGLRRNALQSDIINPDTLIQYAPRALSDLISVLREDESTIFSQVAVERMRLIPPWQVITGDGLTQESLWSLLKPFGIAPEPVTMDGDGTVQQIGYRRTVLEEGARSPLEVWVARIGHQPAIPPKARRIRDLRPRRERESRRKLIDSKGWIPYVLCDAVGCYWDGASVLKADGSRDVLAWSLAQDELVNMCQSGHFGEWMKDVFLHQERWLRIYGDLVEFPSAAMILRDSLHLPGQAVTARTERSIRPEMLDSSETSGNPRCSTSRRPRSFDPSQSVEAYVGGDQPLHAEEVLALQEKAARGHHQILVSLYEYLVKSGWQSIEEVPGALDLWAVCPDSSRVIFEAKTIGDDNEIDQCRAALAQLLEYRFFFGRPSDRLCLVVDRLISDARGQVLESAGVAVISVENSQLRGVGATGERLLELPSRS